MQEPVSESFFERELRTVRRSIVLMMLAVMAGIAAVVWLQVTDRIDGQFDRTSQLVRLGLDILVVALLILSRNAGPWLVTQPLQEIAPEDYDDVAVTRLMVGSMLSGGLALAGAGVGVAIAAFLGHAVDAYVFGAVALVLLVLASPSRKVWTTWIEDFELVVRRV